MFSTLLYYIVQLLIVGPFETQLNERLIAAQAPAAVISQVKSCATAAIPAFVQRVSNDPWQGVLLAGSIWIGTTQAEDVVVATSPSCQPAVESARRYLNQQQS